MDATSLSTYDHSPAENMADSFVSTPGSYYPPLFDNTINPIEALTPQSLDGDCHYNNALTGISFPEKKSIKKRKSWGQQLPEPKTNLPPRKRAKTEDEKEQRRVERVLRNRRAAQSSRERKRQEVEALEAEKRAIERKNMDLEMRLADMEAKYHLLQLELERYGGCSKAVFRSYSVSPNSNSPELLHPSPITFSMELFSSRDEMNRPISPRSLSSRASGTVDPTALSPKTRNSVDSFNVNSSDMIQHPAAVLVDLQCQSEVARQWMNTTLIISTMIILLLVVMVVVVTYLFMTCGASSRFPILLILTDKYSKKAFSLSQTILFLNLITKMVATMAFLKILFFATTLTMRPHLAKFIVRTNSLRRLLACSPSLARPLMDATMAALRSESNQLYVRVFFSWRGLHNLVDRRSNLGVFQGILRILHGDRRDERYEISLLKTRMNKGTELCNGDQEDTTNKERLNFFPTHLMAFVSRVIIINYSSGYILHHN